VGADSQTADIRELHSVNPATGERIGSVLTSGAGDVAAAVRDVAEVQLFWRELPRSARARQLRRLARTTLDLGNDVADLLAREQGRPLTETWTMEVIPAMRALRWLSTAGGRELASRRVRGNARRPLPLDSRLSIEPGAVVIAELDTGIPWRTAAENAGAALIAGAGVVLAPTPRCALTGERFRDLAISAGLPEALIRVVQGYEPSDPLLAAADADRVLGPAPLTSGHRGAADAAAARTGAAMLVLDDAELERALATASWGAFAHAGQGPFAIRHVFVAGDAGRRFAEALAHRAERLRIGDPRHWDTEVGPLIDGAALAALEDELAAAVAAGAKRHCGGPLAVEGLRGAFCAPVVLEGYGVRRNAPGPIVAVSVWDSNAEALAAAREPGPWSAVSVWTRDSALGVRMAPDIPAGRVWVNAHDPSLDPAALTLAVNAGVRRRPLGVGVGRDARWYPYADVVGPSAQALARLLYGRESDRTRIAIGDRRALLRAARRGLRAGRR